MEPQISIVIPVYNVELYLERMLQSVATQSFDDFEAIIIDDCSTDKSGDIIKNFCQNDSRFRYYRHETNRGLPSARNTGMEYAIGKYIVFYDSDDVVPPKALKSLYTVAEKRNADLVIGIFEIVEGFKTKMSQPSRRMGLRKKIPPYSPDLAWSFGVWNKLFRRDILVDNDLWFENYSFNEDAVFVNKYFGLCRNIAGCNTIVYKYYLRPFWENASITQTIRRDRLCDAIRAYDQVFETVNERIEKDELMLKQNGSGDERFNAAHNAHEFFLQKLYSRVIGFNVLGGFYRKIWLADVDITTVVSEAIARFRNNISEKTWDGIVKSNSDLGLENGLMTKEELAVNPVVSFVVTNSVEPQSIPFIIGGLYNQSVPAFEIILPYEFMDFVPEKYIKARNLKIIDKESGSDCIAIINNALGQYINIISEDVFCTVNCIRVMYNLLENNEHYDYVSVPIKHIEKKTNLISDIEVLEKCYSRHHEYLKEYFDYDKLDWCLSNKLFRKDVLINRQKKIDLTHKFPLEGVYNELYHGKSSETFMLSYSLNDNSIILKIPEYEQFREYDSKVIQGTLRKKIFESYICPNIYKKNSRKNSDVNSIVVLEGKSKRLSAGLKFEIEKLNEEYRGNIRVFFLQREYCQKYRYEKFYEAAADARYIITNSPEFLNNIKLRTETVVISADIESSLKYIYNESRFKNIAGQLYKSFPQLRTKKKILCDSLDYFTKEELKLFKKKLPMDCTIMMWDENWLDHRIQKWKMYDKKIVDVTELVDFEEALFFCDYLISDNIESCILANSIMRPTIEISDFDAMIAKIKNTVDIIE